MLQAPARACRALAALACLLALLLPASVARAASPAIASADVERVRSYDVLLTVRPDGGLHVRESIGYDFGTAAKHGIFRAIPTRVSFDATHDRVYRVHDVTVTSPTGAPSSVQVTDGATTRIRVGDPATTVTGRQSYVITYDVDGALNPFPDAAELYWNAIGTEWTVPIDAATARVEVPGTVLRQRCLTGPAGSTTSCAVRAAGKTATFSQAALAPGSALTVVVAMPPDAVASTGPELVERRRQRTGNVGGLALPFAFLGVLIPLLFVALAIVLVLSRRSRRQRPRTSAFASYADTERPSAPPIVDGQPVTRETSPPDGLRPAQLGTLVDAEANDIDISATVVDLAVRGWLHLEEVPGRGPDWRLSRRGGDGRSLLPYEQRLLGALFSRGNVVMLSALRGRLARDVRQVKKDLYADAT